MTRRFAILLLGWLSIVSAFGQTPSTPSASYDVEVLVFEMQLPELEGAELWTRIDQPMDATEAVLPNEMPPTEDFAATAEALRSDARFRVLLQKRWVQTAEPKSGGPAMQLATWDRELDGTLKFYLSRFLHIELNLLFQPKTAVIGGDAAPSYVIREQRRVRSNEINYFDHPKFGVLVRVTPVAG